jgi:hypothetical protein
MKGHNLIWVNLWLFQSFWVGYVAYFNIFLQNLFHSFLHTSCQHCWHTVDDYKKVVIHGLFWFLVKQQQQLIHDLLW